MIRKDIICELLEKLTSINRARHDLIASEILSLYEQFKNELDKDWEKEFLDPKKTRNRLLELALLNELNKVGNLEVKRYRENTQKQPDFQFRTTTNLYALEVTSVGIPNNDSSKLREICNKIETGEYRSSDLFDLHPEFKSRLTQAIEEKSKYKNVLHKDVGFILFVSLGEIPIQPERHVLLEALYGYGNYFYSINKQKKVHNMGFEYLDKFKKDKTKPESDISNKYLLHDDNKWISAIILSGKDPFDLLDWNINEKNDFIIAHNPYANIPLKEGSLPSMTECFFETHIRCIGHNFFPNYNAVFGN